MSHYWRTDRLPNLKNKKILLDTNIWIYLFCEIGAYNKRSVNLYSKAFFILLKSGNTFYTDLIILSEFINRYLRIACASYKEREHLPYIDFKKDYRITDDYKNAWETVCDIVRNSILSHSQIINASYESALITKLLKQDMTDTDFNDNHIVNLCQVEDLFLMTNDADFKNTDLNVITENNVYWNS